MRSAFSFSKSRAAWLCSLAALSLGLTLPEIRADEQGRRELERAREGGAKPAYLIKLLDALIADESEPPQRRGQWRVERERLRAEIARQRAAELLAAADADADSQAGLPELKESLARLREIQRGRWADPSRDPSLIQRLERRINWAEVRPLANELERTLAQAREPGRADAEAFYTRARELQSEINRRFPDSAQASVARLKVIDGELAALRRGDRERLVEQLLDKAEAEARADRAPERERLVQEAVRLRAQLDAKLSPAEAAERRAALSRRVQTIRALPQVLLATRLEAEAAALLRAGDAEAAAQRLEAAMTEITAASNAYPDGVALEPALRDRLAYLTPRRARLADLQKEFSALLSPVPGQPRLLMMRVEMPQGLHERVANLNPSRVSGVNRPVESVSWTDAMAVAQRLGWIMGAEVRLPTQAEWVAALADGEQAGWLAENSEGLVRDTALLAANSAGFHDLVGNVAEWLLPESGRPSPTAGVAGGSVGDSLQAVLAEPVRQVNGARRDRLIGYRLVLVQPSIAVER